MAGSVGWQVEATGARSSDSVPLVEDQHPRLLVGEDVLDPSPHGRASVVGARRVSGDRPAGRLLAMDARDPAAPMPKEISVHMLG
jgi:hypothetical protein